MFPSTMDNEWVVRMNNLGGIVVRMPPRAGQPSRGWDFTVADWFVRTGAWEFVDPDTPVDSDMTVDPNWDTMTDAELASWMLMED